MNISSIGSGVKPYVPQNAGSQDNIAQLESQLDVLNKQLNEVKQNDKLEPEKRKKQIQDIEKKIAEIEKKIAQMKQKGNNTNQTQIEDAKEQDLSKEKPPSNHQIDEYV